MTKSIVIGGCVKIPDGRIARVREKVNNQRELQNSLWRPNSMILTLGRNLRKLTYLVESRRLAQICDSDGKSADLAPNGVLQLPHQYKVRVRRKTSHSHQFLNIDAQDLSPVDCPKGWMSVEGYKSYLKTTLAKMKARKQKKS